MLHLLLPLTCTVITATVIGQSQEKTPAVEQKFRVTPKNIVIEEGSDVVLPCEVDNRIGNVQWTKDGYALGYDPKPQGYPRYMFAVNETRGEFNLEIRRASVEDFSEFECQVSPSKNSSVRGSAIRASALLKVVAPPVSVTINDFTNGQKVRIRDQETVKLSCVAKRSSPAATIFWTRGNSNLTLESQENKMIDCEEKNQYVKICNTSSIITFQVVKADDGVNYTCTARTNNTRKSLSTSIHFEVLYPSEKPYIEGYEKDDAVRTGTNIELICHARNGNPLPQLIWYRNGISVQSVYRTFEKRSQNKHNVLANESENGANYTCEARSPAMSTPMIESIILNVYFGPNEIKIAGGDTGEASKTVSLSCTTSCSYPAAIIEWYVDEKSTNSTKVKKIDGPCNGFITTSYLDLIIPKGKQELSVRCRGVNPRLSDYVTTKHTIQILHPPGEPIITGYVRGSYISAGTIQNLTCTSIGGNPLATLTWYKNGNKMIKSVTNRDPFSAFSIISIRAHASDNGAEYKCEATNSATSTPLQKAIGLKVYFAPSNINVAVIPDVVRAGSKVELQCNSSSSNPQAGVSWWRNGIPINEDITTETDPGEYNGTFSRSKLTINVTTDMNRDVFSCEAKNTVLNSAIHQAVTLNVLYKPIFFPLNQTEFEVTEGEHFQITLQVDSNPIPKTFHWMKDGSSRAFNHITVPKLEIGNINRSYTGLYECTTSNSEGSAHISFSLKVKYAAKIVHIPPYVIAKEGSSAQLNCTVDGYPITTSHISWDRKELKTWERVSFDFERNTSFLTIRSINKTDGGYFYCIADNTIPPADKKSVHLLIEGPPVIRVAVKKVAVSLNNTAKINCAASGAPKVTFVWKKSGSEIPNSEKYEITYNQIDYQNYTSLLTIKSVSADDYGNYDCVASNEHGNVNLTYQLMVISKPEAPSDLELVNLSSDSITLRWKLTFDGGSQTSFRIRYRILNNSESSYKYEDVTQNTNHIVKLAPGSYAFDVVARNNMGCSDYSAPINVTVPGEVKKSTAASFGGDGILILTVAALIGLILILLNVFLILIFIFRRAKKKQEKVSDRTSEHSSSKSRSIELFGSSSLNGTLSRGTPSSQSDEKSTSSSDVNRHFMNEEINQQRPDVYLVEPVNCSIYRGDHILPPQVRYNNIPYHYNNSYGRNTYAANQNGNDYTSLNRSHLRKNSTHNNAWQNTMLPTKHGEPTYLTNHSDESSPTLPPPMATFNYANFQERFLRI